MPPRSVLARTARSTGGLRRRIAARPGGGLTWAETSLDTPHGHVAVNWRVTPDGQLSVDATVPDGVTAEIDLPGAPVSRVGSGRHHLTG